MGEEGVVSWRASRTNDVLPAREFIAGANAWAEFLEHHPHGKLYETLLWMGFRLKMAGWRQ